MGQGLELSIFNNYGYIHIQVNWDMIFSPGCIMKRVGTGAWRLSHMTGGGGSVLNRYEVGHTLESTLALDFTLMT